MWHEDKEDAQAALRAGSALPVASRAGAGIEKLTCMYPLAWGVSDILRGSSDAALCADLAPLADSHLDGCDLLRCCIIDDGARQVLTTPSATHRLSFSSGEMRVSIAMFLDGQNFDPETKRVMGVAFEIQAPPSDLRIDTISSSKSSPVRSLSLRKLASAARTCFASGPLNDLRQPPPQI